MLQELLVTVMAPTTTHQPQQQVTGRMTLMLQELLVTVMAPTTTHQPQQQVTGRMTLMLQELLVTAMAPTTTHQPQQQETGRRILMLQELLVTAMAHSTTHRLQLEIPRLALTLMEHGLPLLLLALGTQLEVGTQMLPQSQTQIPLTSELSKIEPNNSKLELM